MGLFDNGSRELREAMGGLATSVGILWDNQERLQEAVRGEGLAALAAEDKGWRPIKGLLTGQDEVDVEDLRAHASEARKLRAYNPIVKRGVVVRNSYIWTDEIEYPEAAKRIIDKPINQANLFGEEACETLEAALDTDGQYFLLVDTSTKEVRQLTFAEITGTYRNPEHNAEIWYYQRSYTRAETDDVTGVTKPEVIVEWYPAIDLEGQPKGTINGQPVNRNKRIEHARVNTIVGTGWGIPDLLGAVYWAGAYKRYLEASYTLSKALARLAFKVSNQSSKGAKSSAARLAGPVPGGESGSTVTLGAGQDLQAINKSGSGINFSAGTPLAAMVSATLDVPLSVLLTDGSAGGRQGAEAALEDPTIKTMNRRRKVHLASRNRVLRALGVDGLATWATLNGDLVHRRIQSIKLAADTGLLHPEESRGEFIRALEIVTEKDATDIPAEYEKRLEKLTQVNTPGEDDGRATGAGPLSDGTNDSRSTPGGATDA